LNKTHHCGAVCDCLSNICLVDDANGIALLDGAESSGRVVDFVALLGTRLVGEIIMRAILKSLRQPIAANSLI